MTIPLSRFDRITLFFLTTICLLIAVLALLGGRALEQAPAAPKVLYLAPGEDDKDADQIFLLELNVGLITTQITRETWGVYDYAPSPDGRSIAYSAFRSDGGTDIWLVDVNGNNRQCLYECASSIGSSANLPLGCSEAAWEPNGRRLVFTLREDSQSPRLWWMDVASTISDVISGDTEPAPVFDDYSLGQMASWSPNGQWLSYVSPVDEGLKVYNFSNGQSMMVSNQTEAPAVWSPQGEALLATNLQFVGEGFSTQLLRADLETGELVVLTVDSNVEDGSPDWSADGQWIVFGRKPARVPVGRQLWMARVDGSNVRSLTDDSEYHHAMSSWSADGRQILFQRSSLLGEVALPGIWKLDVVSGEMVELASPGYRPVWLP